MYQSYYNTHLISDLLFFCVLFDFESARMKQRIITLVSLLLVALFSLQNLCYCDEQTVNLHFIVKFLFLRFCSYVI